MFIGTDISWLDHGFRQARAVHCTTALSKWCRFSWTRNMCRVWRSGRRSSVRTKFFSSSDNIKLGIEFDNSEMCIPKFTRLHRQRSHPNALIPSQHSCIEFLKTQVPQYKSSSEPEALRYSKTRPNKNQIVTIWAEPSRLEGGIRSALNWYRRHSQHEHLWSQSPFAPRVGKLIAWR